MHKTLTGVQGMGALSEFDRLERKVEQQEARAQAYTDLSTDTLDSKFEALESESEVDRQLRELKAARPQGQLPPGDRRPGNHRPWTEVHVYHRAVATRLPGTGVEMTVRPVGTLRGKAGLTPEEVTWLQPTAAW